MHLLVVAAGMVVLVAALELLGVLFGRRHRETLDFRGPVRAVEVVIAAGDVTIRGRDRDDARVRRTVRRGLRRARVVERVEEGVLRLDAPTGIVRYELDVPRRSRVVVRGDAASATVIAVEGRVELHAGAGSFEGRALAGREVLAVTNGGSIRLSFDRAPSLVEASTGSGAVDLALPDGPYDVEVDAPVGRAKVSVRTGESDRRVHAHTGAGAVRIRPR